MSNNSLHKDRKRRAAVASAVSSFNFTYSQAPVPFAACKAERWATRILEK